MDINITLLTKKYYFNLYNRNGVIIHKEEGIAVNYPKIAYLYSVVIPQVGMVQVLRNMQNYILALNMVTVLVYKDSLMHYLR